MGVLHVVTETEWEICIRYGQLRNDANRKIGRKDNRTAGFDSRSIDVVGVAGEMAVSKVTGIPWTGRFTPASKLTEWLKKPQPDLCEDVEVRTRTKPWHQLLVHKNDPLSWRYVLVRLVEANTLDIVGWAHGDEVKQEKFWNPMLPYPAYGYPNLFLRPIEELT